MKKRLQHSIIILFFIMCSSAGSRAQEAFIGEIKLVAFNFVPRGWASCEGQLLPIAQHNALFSLLGTYYGGDGRTTFALPDLRGRVPVGIGNVPAAAPVKLAEQLPAIPIPADKTGRRPATPAAKTIPALGLRYVICLVGVFPSRN